MTRVGAWTLAVVIPRVLIPNNIGLRDWGFSTIHGVIVWYTLELVVTLEVRIAPGVRIRPRNRLSGNMLLPRSHL